MHDVTVPLPDWYPTLGGGVHMKFAISFIVAATAGVVCAGNAGKNKELKRL